MLWLAGGRRPLRRESLGGAAWPPSTGSGPRGGHRINATGAIIVIAGFAALWWVVGVAASGRPSVLLYAIPLLVSSGLIIAALRGLAHVPPLASGERARRARVVGITSGVEGLIIFATVNVLSNIGQREFTVSAVAMVVGLHFLPLARGLRVRLYYVTGGALIALGVAGCFVPGANSRLLAVSVGAACVLWLTCARVLQRAHAA